MENMFTRESITEAFQMLTFKEKMDLSPEALEENFCFEKLLETSKISALEYHFAMINNPEMFVGSGDNAIVFQGKDIPEVCVKCRWEPIPTVNNKSKKINQLPPELIGLKKVQNYFEKVNKRKNARIQKGAEFVSQRKSLHEAILTKKAHAILVEAEMGQCSPEMQYVIKIDHEESGICAPNDPYYAHETIYMLYMGKIKGQNLEELIKEGSEQSAEKINVETFMSLLEKIVTTLHKGGIYHNDLSLRNVMIDTETWEPRVIDFGASEYKPDRPEYESSDSDDIAYLQNDIKKWLTKFVSDPKKASSELQLNQERKLDKF